MADWGNSHRRAEHWAASPQRLELGISTHREPAVEKDPIRDHAAGAGLTSPPHTSPAAFPRRAPAHYRAATGGRGQSPGHRTEGQCKVLRTIVCYRSM